MCHSLIVSIIWFSLQPKSGCFLLILMLNDLFEWSVFQSFRYKAENTCEISTAVRESFFFCCKIRKLIFLHNPTFRYSPHRYLYLFSRCMAVFSQNIYVVCCCLVAKVVFDSFASPWTVAIQAPLSMGFLRQEYWSELPFPSPGNLLDSGIAPISCHSCIGRQILYHWRPTWKAQKGNHNQGETEPLAFFFLSWDTLLYK